MIVLICILLLILVTGCSAPQQESSVHMCRAIPSPRAGATGFVYDGKAYVFGGRDADGTCLNDLWCYDPVVDTWSSLGATPLKPRLNATACVSDGDVYIGLGYTGKGSNSGYYADSSYLQDWYRFSPVTMTFTPLASYPNHATDKAISWAHTSDKLYVGYGFRYNYTRDIFCYNVSTDRWDSIDTHVSYMGYPSRCFGATGVVWNGKMFAGTGYRRFSLNWWAELIPDDDYSAQWQKRHNAPAPERTLAASAATDEFIYLAGGIHYGGINTNGQFLSDVLRYQPVTDKWQRIAALPEPLFNHVAFRIGRDVYCGIGETWHNDSLCLSPNLYRWREE